MKSAVLGLVQFGRELKLAWKIMNSASLKSTNDLNS